MAKEKPSQEELKKRLQEDAKGAHDVLPERLNLSQVIERIGLVLKERSR